MGASLDKVDYPVWFDRFVRTKLKEDPAHALSSFEMTCDGENWESWADTYIGGEDTGDLSALGLKFPAMDGQVLQMYLGNLVDSSAT